MEMHDFQVNTEKGGINVQFHLDFDGIQAKIENIHIHSSYGSGLPHHPKLGYHNGENVFVVELHRKIDGEVKAVTEYFINDLARHIIKQIFDIAAKHTPKFGD